MLLGTLCASLLGNMSAVKESQEQAMIFKTFNLKKERNCKSRLWIQIGFLILPHPLTNLL